MTQTQTNTSIKMISPTLHLYYYVLRNGMNEPVEELEKRRHFFNENLQKITSHLTSKNGENAAKFITLLPLQQDPKITGSVLDFSKIPTECKKNNNDRVYLTTGIINSRLAARRLNDTYLLRLTRYISSIEGQQSLNIFSNLSEHLSNLELELGQTVILAGILPDTTTLEQNRTIATHSLNQYYNQEIDTNKLITDEFLDSPFYIYTQSVEVKKSNKYSVEAIKLACVFLYKNETVETKSATAYRILQNLLLSYHKINFFYSQSLVLKTLLEEQYKKIECLTEDYAKQEWDSKKLKQIPQDSLKYYQRLSFLEDQAKLVEFNLKNYQECLQQIKDKTGYELPKFFQNFAGESEFYLEQMQANIAFLQPALHLYDKLMLSVQTQVSIEEAQRQENKSKKEAQLAQIFTGIGTAIAVGQLLTEPLIKTISQYLEPTQQNPSLKSLWLGTIFSICISLMVGFIISWIAYKWLKKD
ncbi:hypothetical protein [Crocosphaera sp.]|uniref:hypothetical protein n=1 Tax=Crocosphaera sp. TaxID=2729996 RepID=UPI00261FA575|nr:hypothetical protein [Crocosphaera sp.]MDJ0578956.1 hypothetical protein [Crocosphaera sp.]